MTRADADWNGTRVASTLSAEGDGTSVEFADTGWTHANQHFRVSAGYLRLLGRHIEHGDVVPYSQR